LVDIATLMEQAEERGVVTGHGAVAVSMEESDWKRIRLFAIRIRPHVQ
jgi:hypothetical protein